MKEKAKKVVPVVTEEKTDLIGSTIGSTAGASFEAWTDERNGDGGESGEAKVLVDPRLARARMVRRMSLYDARIAPRVLTGEEAEAGVGLSDDGAVAKRAEELAALAGDISRKRGVGESVTAREVFSDFPIELYDEPLPRITTAFRGKGFAARLRLCVGYLSEIMVHVVVLVAVFAAVTYYRRDVVFPEVHGTTGQGKNESWLYGLDKAIAAVFTVWSPAVMLWLLFGTRAKPVMVWTFCFSLAFSLTWAIVEATVDMPTTVRSGAYFLAYAVSTLCGSEYMRRRVRDRVHLYFSLPICSGALVFGVYSQQLPRVFAMMTTDTQRALFRLLVHPVIFEVCLLLTRIGTRNLHASRPHASAMSMSLYFLVASSIYGRFLTLANESSTTTLVVTLVLAAEEIFLRLSVGGRDKLIYRLFKPKDQVSEIFSTPRAHRIRSDIVAMDVMLEYASICTAAVAMYALRVSIGSSGAFTAERIATDVAFQLGVELATDICVVFMEEAALGVPVIDGWKARYAGKKRKYWAVLVFFYTIAAVFIIGTLFHPTAGLEAAMRKAGRIQ